MTATIAQEKPKNGFKSTLSVGVSLTDGNSETLQANAAIITEGEKTGLGSVRAGIEGNYGESTVDDQKDTTVENARVFSNVKKTISTMTFGYMDGSVLYDDIAQIDYRATIGPGLGVYLLKNDKSSFSIEIGGSYIWESVADVSDNYFAIRFAERFSHAISGTAKIWQSAEYLPKANDFQDYLLTAELGAESAMTERLNMRIVIQDKFDSTPGAELEKNDLALIAGISLSL